MTVKIQQLPSTLVNQIAAGEVIERPASVVKELLENALDAKATHIIVSLSFGGMNAITVSDNGVGIPSDELPLAIAPHATSKIKDLEDLSAICTMGFRGEALASIASVSRFTLQSRPVEADCAMQLTLHEELTQLTPCAREVGTTVMVNDLFYNTPVRKRFLGSEKTEFLAIDRLVRCFALSAPQLKLDFYHQGQCVFQLPAGTHDTLRLHRLQKIVGKGFVDAARPIHSQYSGLSISGWIAGPQFARSQQDRMWVYVNQRMVNDKLLNHAIKQAYEGQLPPGRYPACVIYIEISPDEVDVNVHPTKHELRFHQPRWIHDALQSTISAALNPPDQAEQQGAVDIMTSSQQISTASAQAFSAKQRSWDWITLNEAFVLLFGGRESLLLHVRPFYESFLRTQLDQVGLPLVSRPLFVPVSIALEQHMHVFEESFVCLAQVGISLSWFGEQVLLVRSIPVMMPHLNLQAFILRILSLSTVTTEVVLAEMVANQALDASVLSDMEKQTWMAFLAQQLEFHSHLPYLKPLSPTHCAALFHA